MVHGRKLTLLQEAISETYILCAMYKHTINPKQIGLFIGYLLTDDLDNANLQWNNVVKDRLMSYGMDMLLIDEIENYLEGL